MEVNINLQMCLISLENYLNYKLLCKIILLCILMKKINDVMRKWYDVNSSMSILICDGLDNSGSNSDMSNGSAAAVGGNRNKEVMEMPLEV